jgi:hypothetical protein
LEFNKAVVLFLTQKKEKPIRVNVCWELKDIRKCETLYKDEAYALKKHLEEVGGFCFWFQALDD